MKKIKISVISPVYNEELVIKEFNYNLIMTLNKCIGIDFEVIYIVDRSTDRTLEILSELTFNDNRITVISLSSRFGHQMSLLAGLKYSQNSDAIIMMDCDLQHPPNIIPSLIDKFKIGYDVVYTVRKNSKDIKFIRKLIGDIFYKLLNKISNTNIEPNASDFRLISRRVAIILVNEFNEQNMFLRGIFSWIGFKQTSVSYVANSRYAGNSKYTISKLYKFAIAGILSFSTKPLQIGIIIGTSFAFIAFLLIIISIVKYFLIQSIPDGWTTMFVVMLIFSATQILIMGIIGLYIGGIYEQVKSRPLFLVDEIIKRSDKIYNDKA